MSLIFCKCGCGQQREEFDKKGRRREYLKGHFTKNKKRPEISARQLGGHLSEETKKKISSNHADVSGKKNPNFGKGLFGEDNGRYNGGKKLRKMRQHNKRRNLGFDEVNDPLHIDDEVAHHLIKEFVSYVPEFINKSVPHNVHAGYNMDEVNFYTLNYLFLVYNKEE